MRKFWPYAALVPPAIALLAGYYFYSQSPGGMLLYTPVANASAHYTPSFQVGFFVAAVGQIALYALFVLVAWLFRMREAMFKALSLLVVSGVLLSFSALPESWWLLTSPHREPVKAALLPSIEMNF